MENLLKQQKTVTCYHSKKLHRTTIYISFLQNEPLKAPHKLQPKFTENKARENTKIWKDLTIKKFKAEIRLIQTCAESMNNKC